MTPIRGAIPAGVFFAAVAEAKVKFGEPRTWNQPMVTAWVRRRCFEVLGQAPAEVRFMPDARERQAGNGE